MIARAYLDWNAAAPLRPEAREAMLGALDVSGNPSSVHAEGRAARAIVEKARAQVAALVRAKPENVIFTGGASEAAATAIASHKGRVFVSAAAHDCLAAHVEAGRAGSLPVDRNGRLVLDNLADRLEPGDLVCVPWANSETGVLESGMAQRYMLDERVRLLRDAAQYAGRLPFDASEPWSDMALLSSAKIGGPRGVGALIVNQRIDVQALIPGGGQEGRRRSGTENVAGIAGFGAAAEASRRDLSNGTWKRVEKIRNILEDRLEASAPDTIFVGREVARLPNTSCFAVPGWKGETQVMQLDLAGFAVSAGSACSSGKVRASRVLGAMGYDDQTAASAIRVSIGPDTTEASVEAFADTWTRLYHRRRDRAA